MQLNTSPMNMVLKDGTKYHCLDDDPQLNCPARKQFCYSLSPALRLQSDTQSCLFYFLVSPKSIEYSVHAHYALAPEFCVLFAFPLLLFPVTLHF